MNAKKHIVDILLQRSMQQAVNTRGKNAGVANVLSRLSKYHRQAAMNQGLRRLMRQKTATYKLNSVIQRNGPLSIAKEAILEGADVNYDNGRLLQLAVDKTRLDIVKELLRAKINVSHATDALHSVFFEGLPNMHILRVLLEYGANPRRHLSTAASRASPEMLQMMLNARNVQRMIQDAGLALLVAIRYARVGNVEILLNAGVPVDFQDITMITPLMDAASLGSIELVQLFIARGASLNLKDRDGLTALGHALKEYRTDTVRVLSQAGALVTFDQVHSMMRRHRRYPADLIRQVIENNRLNFKTRVDSSYKSLLWIALHEYEDPILVKMLLDRGARLTIKEAKSKQAVTKNVRAVVNQFELEKKQRQSVKRRKL